MATEVSKAIGHDTVLDVTAEQLARVYAQAFIKAVGSGDGVSTDDAVAELNAVVEEVVGKHPEFGEALQSAFLSHEERVAMLDRVLAGRVDGVVLNTLKVMSAHNRLGLVKTVARQAEKLNNEINGRLQVAVQSAAPLGDDLLNELKAMLGSKLGIDPVLLPSVDPEMIAGLKVRVGDTMYDGSLQTVFAKARQSMIDRAIEKIEGNPEHFLSETKNQEQ